MSIVAPTFSLMCNNFIDDPITWLTPENENESEKKDWDKKYFEEKPITNYVILNYNNGMFKEVSQYKSIFLKCFSPPPEV